MAHQARRWWWLLTWAVLLAWTSVQGRAQAQVAPCGDNEIVAPWISAAVGTDAGGTTQAPSTTSVRLCSAAVGLDARVDQYHVARQSMPGDFHVQALLVALDDGGAGGLIAIAPVLEPDAARIAIEARANAGVITVRSSIRRGQGGVAEPWSDAITTTLPATLRIRRVDSMMRTELEDNAGLHLLSTENVAESALDGLLHAGMYQASLDQTTPRTALFGRLNVSDPPEPPGLDCIETAALIPGAEMTMYGTNLGGVRSVTLAGQAAEVISARTDRITLRVGEPSSAGFLAGDIVLDGAAGARLMSGGVAYTGAPFIRGDTDGDGQVDRADWTRICHQVHRSKPLACGASGDINGDGNVNQGDLDHLKAFLQGTGRAPVGPYPTAGYVSDALSCGLPSAPEISNVTRDNGAPVASALSEGDVLMIDGRDLPERDNATVYFGDVPAYVLPGSSPTQLRVRIGAVVSSGPRCPVVWRGTSPRGRTRFGQAFTIAEDPTLCPTFTASRRALALNSHVRGDQVELSLPRTSYPAGQAVLVDAAFHLPFVDGKTRGPRAVRKEILLPAGGDGYREGLQHLASELQKALQGPSDDACDCELQVLPNVLEETLTIAPCDPLPPEPPTPTVPGLPTQVLPTRRIVGHLSLLSPDPPHVVCDNETSYEDDKLGWSWCQVEQVMLPPEESEFGVDEEYPLFESLVPIQMSLDENVEPWVFTPEDKPWLQKQTLVDHDVDVGIDHYGYDDGCEYTLRNARCNQPVERGWMPRFREGGRIVKLFWLAQSHVPNGLDVGSLYSWVPGDDHNPNTIEERQYLVGMHVNVATNTPWPNGDVWFRWITAWFPLPDGITSSRYRNDCVDGTAVKRPASLAGTAFADWVLCNPEVAGQEGCGNPWAPIDECSTPAKRGCIQCHREQGAFLGIDPAWIVKTVFLKGADKIACDNALADDPNYRPSWGGAPLMSTPPSWVPICGDSIDFGAPWRCHLSAPICSETPGYPQP